MDKTITTALMIVISMIMAVALFNAVYPAVLDSGNAISGMTRRTDERLQSQIEIIHAASELDSTGWWQDTNGNGDFDTFIWVKNVGETRVAALDQIDVFFGPEGNYTRIPPQGSASGYPFWIGEIVNADEWTPSATLQITVHYGAPLPAGRYFMKVSLPNGISDEHFMGM